MSLDSSYTPETCVEPNCTNFMHYHPSHICSESRNSYRKPIAVRFDLIPPVFLRDLAEVYEEGAQNYGVAKYIEKPLPFSSIINHMENHFNLWLSGDRSEKHLAKIAWGCATLIVLEELILANEIDKNIADVTKYGTKANEALQRRAQETNDAKKRNFTDNSHLYVDGKKDALDM